MPRKGQLENRKVRRGPNRGSSAKLVTIRDARGNIKHSYREYSAKAYAASKRRKGGGRRKRK